MISKIFSILKLLRMFALPLCPERNLNMPWILHLLCGHLNLVVFFFFFFFYLSYCSSIKNKIAIIFYPIITIRWLSSSKAKKCCLFNTYNTIQMNHLLVFLVSMTYQALTDSHSFNENLAFDSKFCFFTVAIIFLDNINIHIGIWDKI